MKNHKNNGSYNPKEKNTTQTNKPSWSSDKKECHNSSCTCNECKACKPCKPCKPNK